VLFDSIYCDRQQAALKGLRNPRRVQMKKIAALLTAAAFSLTLGIASAEDGSPWEQKETTPLLKMNKNGKQKEVKKGKKATKKKQKAKKKVKKEK
jgi:hypothetical protein